MSATKEKLNNIEKYFRKEIREKNFSKLLVTVSGGADSVALLSALSSTGAIIIAAHCNFHLRGEESMRDQRHVENICHILNAQLLIKDFDIPNFLKKNPGYSVEMACREVRYGWFEEIQAAEKCDRIVTGHNADDNIETLLLNLLRGSGTSGLKGMIPDTGSIWRPLLSFHRPQIEAYLKEKGIEYITDSSNLSCDYRRNYLRNRIIPLLREEWKGFDKSLDRSIALIRSENAVVNEATESLLPPPGEPLSAETVMSFPAPQLLVRRYIEPLLPFTTTAAEVVSAIIADKPDKRCWKLRGGTLTLRNRKLYSNFFE